jgi:hypothetical protein
VTCKASCFRKTLPCERGKLLYLSPFNYSIGLLDCFVGLFFSVSNAENDRLESKLLIHNQLQEHFQEPLPSSSSPPPPPQQEQQQQQNCSCAVSPQPIAILDGGFLLALNARRRYEVHTDAVIHRLEGQLRNLTLQLSNGMPHPFSL